MTWMHDESTTAIEIPSSELLPGYRFTRFKKVGRDRGDKVPKRGWGFKRQDKGTLRKNISRLGPRLKGRDISS